MADITSSTALSHPGMLRLALLADLLGPLQNFAVAVQARVSARRIEYIRKRHLYQRTEPLPFWQYYGWR